jgi:hypothetical protein
MHSPAQEDGQGFRMFLQESTHQGLGSDCHLSRSPLRHPEQIVPSWPIVFVPAQPKGV